jgi:hypothetical protein
MVNLLDRAVEGHDGEAVVVHVQNEILAHDGQTDKCNVSLWFHKKLKKQISEGTRYKIASPLPAVFWRKPTLACHEK